MAEHVFKSVEHAPHLVIGRSKPTERDPAEHVPNLRQMFLNFETKMKSPDFILPSNDPKDLQELTQN